MHEALRQRSNLGLPKRPVRVFISHRREDSSRARQLQLASQAVPDLELYAFQDDQLSCDDWRETCRSLIGAADALVCLVGPTTTDSLNVAWELDEARKGGLHILLAGNGAGALAQLRGHHDVDTVEDGSSETVLARLRYLV